MGGKPWVIIIGFQLKLSLGLLLTAHRSATSSSHFFPCSASPPFLHRNFRYIFYVAIFSNLSHFFPVLAHAYAGIIFALYLLLFLPKQLTQTLFIPSIPPFPLGGVPTIHSYTVVMVWGPGIHQTAEITTQVIL